MDIRIISFTANGSRVNRRLLEYFGKKGHRAAGFAIARFAMEHGLSPLEIPLQDWTKEAFSDADALIFIGACGIAVRSIAPFIRKKTADPAVLVIDEQANFAISLLSGHIGGGNALAEETAKELGATAVITTATDVNQLFAVDVFARKNNLYIDSMELAKQISAAILEKKFVGFSCRFMVSGDKPKELQTKDTDWIFSGENTCVLDDKPGDLQREATATIPPGEDTRILGDKPEDLPGEATAEIPSEEDVHILDSNPENLPEKDRGPLGICVTLSERESPYHRTLRLIPRIVVLGVGCRKNKEFQTIETHILRTLDQADVSIHAVRKVATIDLKKEEPGLLAFCEKYGLPLEVFTAEQLSQVPGIFTESTYVRSVTGVDNVCERSAVLASNGGALICRKTAADGVTTALAIEEWSVEFE